MCVVQYEVLSDKIHNVKVMVRDLKEILFNVVSGLAAFLLIFFSIQNPILNSVLNFHCPLHLQHFKFLLLRSTETCDLG